MLLANLRLDWKVIVRYKHSSLFDLVISNEGKKGSITLTPGDAPDFLSRGAVHTVSNFRTFPSERSDFFPFFFVRRGRNSGDCRRDEAEEATKRRSPVFGGNLARKRTQLFTFLGGPVPQNFFLQFLP